MSTKPTILLVEDDPAIRHVYEQKLQHGFDFISASNLAEAIKALDVVKRDPDALMFDLIIIDPGLPDSPREATVEAIKSCSGDIPLVVLSGNIDDQQKPGVYKCIEKGPADWHELAEMLRDAIFSRRSAERFREIWALTASMKKNPEECK